MLDKISEKISKLIVDGVEYIVKGLTVKVVNRTLTVNGKTIVSNLNDEVKIKWEGDLASLDAGGSVECGDVHGNVDAGNGVKCGNVSGNVDAGNGVNCGNVGGDVDAGNSVICLGVKGDVDACGGISMRK